MIRLEPRRLAGVVAATTVLLGLSWLPAPPPASAHSDPTVMVELHGVKPALPTGVHLDVLDAEQVDAVLVNDTGVPVSVLDPKGNPFLRVSSDGVLGDVRSPYLRATAQQLDDAKPVREASGSSGRWMRLTGENGWAWADPRLDPSLLRAARTGGNRGLGSLQANGPLAAWKIGLRYGSQASTANGVFERRPSGRVVTTIDSAPKGVTAGMIDGRSPMLHLVIPAGVSLEVLGRDGRPYVRMGPKGCFARSDSPEYRYHQQVIGLTPSTGSTWVPMDSGSATKLMLADDRLSYWKRLPTASVTHPVVLSRWKLPIVFRGKESEVSGTATWQPATVPGADTTAPSNGQRPNGALAYVIAGACTVVLVLAFCVARFSSRAGAGSSDEQE